MVTSTKPTMTASEAVSFERFSLANAITVTAALSCGCKPYEDVFTFNRWKAQGFFVKRGEHALKLPIVKHAVKETLDDSGETKTSSFRILGTSAVFCRHQVEQRQAAKLEEVA